MTGWHHTICQMMRDIRDANPFPGVPIIFGPDVFIFIGRNTPLYPQRPANDNRL